MDTKQNLIEQVSTMVEDIDQNAEGYDKRVVLEALNVKDFSEPVDGEDLIDQLRKEGLI